MNKIPLGDNSRCDRAAKNHRDQQVLEDDLTEEEIEDFQNEGGIIQ
jgi:hypothetical protein